MFGLLSQHNPSVSTIVTDRQEYEQLTTVFVVECEICKKNECL